MPGVDSAMPPRRGSVQGQTHTVTRKQLSQAVEMLAMGLQSRPADALGWTSRFRQLITSARTVADMAQAFSQERAEGPEGELRVWADAVRACVESHLRDVELLLPWVRLGPKDLVALFDHQSGPAPEWSAIASFFHPIPTLAAAPERFVEALCALECLREQVRSRPSQDRSTLARITLLVDVVRQSAADIAALTRRLAAIAQTSEQMVHAMDFTFLFDSTRKLLSIGYRMTENSLDPSCYDLLASEARLASFIAIAKGDIPSSHWFHLGRALTPVGNGSALISWSGSIFEYLMPALVMRFPAGSLLSRTYELIVCRQIQYGAERGVPWGVSESAYNARDLDLTYQYSSFGVPGLGLKRGLIDDVVVAPYATALAAMIDPSAAAQGFGRLAEAGGRGPYGFYEALDY
ncbi:MAG: phosphorylase, partial [Nitrospira sp.]|nr:phosphorylase [Nitrospira sp.]